MAESDRILDTFLAIRTRIVRLVVGIVPPKEVEDIVQETYVRVCQIKNGQAIREPSSFMFRTARNLALDYVKRAESRLTSGTDSIDELSGTSLTAGGDETFAQVSSNEEFALFCEAVRHLPQQCRRAFVLKKVYGYTLREIADEMGLGLPTVETHIVAGTKKCVRYLRERESTDAVRERSRPGSRSNESMRGGGA